MSELQILHETSDYAVILKPAGMLSQPAKGGEGADVLTILTNRWNHMAYPIHRLDRETAGVMVVGKRKSASAALSEQAASGEMKKEYLAVVHGICPEEGAMTDLLLHRCAGNKSFVVDHMRSGVKEARLTFRRLAACHLPEPSSLVRVWLQTGRTHQIRVQFAHRAHPLLGDRKYGSHAPGGLRLFCDKLSFRDPSLGKTVCFSAVPEGDEWREWRFAIK